MKTLMRLYVSLDNLWFLSHSLAELIEYHHLHGGPHLFLDEVHHYPHWQTLLKNIVDEYSSMHVVRHVKWARHFECWKRR